MKKRAFSLVEVVVVIAILCVLMAIISPAIWRAKHSADMTSSAARLRQLAMAVHIYQEEWGVDGMTHQTLPHSGYVYSMFFGLGKDFFESPCGYKDGIESNSMHISYQYWWEPVDSDIYDKYGEQTPLFSDPHCNDSVDQWRSIYQSKRGIVVLYSGTVLNHFKPGDPGDMEWWAEK